MKEVGMLVFLLRIAYFRFWSQLGCSAENAICIPYVAVKVSISTCINLLLVQIFI